jgi:membrane-associated phospholipid phosphatase
MRRVLCTTAAAIALPLAAVGQDRSLKYDGEHVFRDAWFIVSAPAHASGGDWQTALLLGCGVAGTVLLDERARDVMRADDVRRVLSLFGESSPINLYGRTKFLASLSAVLYGAGWAFGSNDLKDAGAGCVTSNLTATATRSAINAITGRARPSAERGAFTVELLGGFGDWSRRSFPGGHGSNAFSCTSFWSHRFDLGPAEPVLYGLAAGVALARSADEAHWLSDSVAGMGYGYAIGKGVAGRYLQREREREERSVQPAFYLVWRITF